MPTEHAVLVHLRLSDGKFGTGREVEQLQELETRIEQAIVDAGSGELDGNEIGEGEYVIFTYGPDADRLFASFEPLLAASRLTKGGHVLKRFGSVDDETARVVRVELK